MPNAARRMRALPKPGAHKAPLQMIQRVGKILRQRRFETLPFIDAGMIKPEFPRVEHLAGIIRGQFCCVNFIAEKRMAEVMKMHPDLMGAAAVQAAFDQASVIAGTNHSILGFRGAPAR